MTSAFKDTEQGLLWSCLELTSATTFVQIDCTFFKVINRTSRNVILMDTDLRCWIKELELILICIAKAISLCYERVTGHFDSLAIPNGSLLTGHSRTTENITYPPCNVEREVYRFLCFCSLSWKSSFLFFFFLPGSINCF